MFSRVKDNMPKDTKVIIILHFYKKNCCLFSWEREI